MWHSKSLGLDFIIAVNINVASVHLISESNHTLFEYKSFIILLSTQFKNNKIFIL